MKMTMSFNSRQVKDLEVYEVFSDMASELLKPLQDELNELRLIGGPYGHGLNESKQQRFKALRSMTYALGDLESKSRKASERTPVARKRPKGRAK